MQIDFSCKIHADCDTGLHSIDATKTGLTFFQGSKMTGEKNALGNTKAAKRPLTIEEEIAKASERLRALQEKKRASDKREKERNHKSVLELLAKEKLDQVSSEKWEEVLPQLKSLLLTTAVEPVKQAQAAKAASTGESGS